MMGTGLLKPNVSTIVGQLYSPEDRRRDAAFSIFYMGINVGALVSPLMILGKGWSLQERKRAGAIAVLFIASAIFWAVYEQAGSSLTLFAERNTNRHLFALLGLHHGEDFLYPASWFQFVQPAFVLILAPIFAWLWIRLGSREPSYPSKFPSLSLIV